MKWNIDIFQLFENDWALLTAGDNMRFNSMTISCGGLGTLLGKPVATVYVKPIRYTHEFMEKSNFFTIGFYPKTGRQALEICGSLSGRSCDKIKRAGLTDAARKGNHIS